MDQEPYIAIAGFRWRQRNKDNPKYWETREGFVDIPRMLPSRWRNHAISELCRAFNQYPCKIEDLTMIIMPRDLVSSKNLESGFDLPNTP